MTDGLRAAVVEGSSLDTLRRFAREAGMASMKEDALRKAAEGITSPHEVGRVIRSDGGNSFSCSACKGEIPMGSQGCPWCGKEQTRACTCGQNLRLAWRFCPSCRRKATQG